MASAFEKVMDTAGRVASGAAKATGKLVNKGYDAATKMQLAELRFALPQGSSVHIHFSLQ